MTQTQKYLCDTILKLPVDKVGKVLSFVRYLEQEPEAELFLDPVEESELYELLASGDLVDSAALLTKIRDLPDD